MTSNEDIAVIAQKGDLNATHELWERVKWLVYKLVSKYSGLCKMYRVEFDDILQSGYIAFTKALKYYDAEKGLKFTSYLQFNVQTAVHDTFEIRGKRNYQFWDSLNDYVFIESSSNVEVLDTLESEEATEALEAVETECNNQALRSKLYELLEVLNEQEATIIKEHYFNNRTFTDIAEEMNLSTQRISGVHQRALQRLRTPYRLHGLKPFMYYDDVKGQGLTAYKRRGFVSKVEQLAGVY